MASLLRSRLNICARRVPILHTSTNNVRCVQRRFASTESSGSNIPIYLPVLGLCSFGVASYFVSLVFVGGHELRTLSGYLSECLI